MTITNGYCTNAQLAATLGPVDADDNDRIDLAINAASRQIDAHCGRPHGFWQDSTVKVRTYHAVEDYELFVVDDISTATGLIVKLDTDDDGQFATTLTSGTDFTLLPLNAAAETPVRPYDRVLLITGSYAFPRSSSRRAGVQITAKFGWPAVPDDVTKACMIQARNLFKSEDASWTGFTFGPDGQALRVPAFDTMCRALLEPFRRVEC